MINVYADESCQTGHRYMVLGGIIVHSDHLDKATSDIYAVRDQHRMYAEFKWEKVSNNKLPGYIDLVNTFFDMPHEVHFHSLTVDTHGLDHVKYNFGSSEIGFSKFIYQLLIKFGRLYGNDETINCYLDKRNTQQSLLELRSILNNGLAKHWNILSMPFRRLQFLESKDSDLLQLNDVLLGALASRTNGHHLRLIASPAKTALSDASKYR